MEHSGLGRRCSRRSENANVLKIFKPQTNIAYKTTKDGDYETATLTDDNRKDAMFARDECVKWCSNQENCFACSSDCSVDKDTCTWNALKQCGAWQFWDGIIEGDVSEKEGRVKKKLET